MSVDEYEHLRESADADDTPRPGEPMDFRGIRADDTTRDPLAALILGGLCEINSDDEVTPHSPDEQECPVVEELRPTSSRLADYLTERGVTLDATRPLRDREGSASPTSPPGLPLMSTPDPLT